MWVRRWLLFALSAGTLGLSAQPASAAACAGADTPLTAATVPAAKAAVLCIVNAERTVRGLPALSQDDDLALAAQRHSDDMVARDFFDHYAPAPAPYGESPTDRIDATGYDWSRAGENIAAGYRTPREAVTGWLKSAGHCRNVLDPDYTELGVGIATAAATLPGGTGTWTQNFGRPRGTAAPSSDTGPQQGCAYDGLQGLDAAGNVVAPGSGGSGTTDGDTGSGAGVAPGTTPPGNAGTTAGKGTLVIAMRHVGRRLTIAGSLAAPDRTRVRIAVKRRGRTVWRGATVLRGGTFVLDLRVPRRARGLAVVVSAGSQRVARTIA
jgi:uncharacterized protein YkwD